MARLFYGSVLVGVLLAVLAAGVFPLPRHERYRSDITVIADGGRAETFLIQWPQDRVVLGAAPGLRQIGAAIALDEGDPAGASVEVYRLRDSAGNVVGLASRSTSQRAAAGGSSVQGTDWVLLLPSRGALFLTQVNQHDVAPRRRATDGELQVAVDDVAGLWSRGNRLRITGGPGGDGAGRVAGGTDEFYGLSGSYDETWDLEEARAGGVTQGRITLVTRLEAGS